jgi:hypothetical protein
MYMHAIVQDKTRFEPGCMLRCILVYLYTASTCFLHWLFVTNTAVSLRKVRATAASNGACNKHTSSAIVKVGLSKKAVTNVTRHSAFMKQREAAMRCAFA